MKTFVLFDLSTNEIRAEVKDENLRTISPPQWTPDGAYLLLAKEVYPPPGQKTHQEFYLVSTDGEISQITHFNDSHEYSEIGGFSLSPDGQKVSFWFMDRSLSWEENLYVLDLQSLKIVDTCITSVGWNGGSGPATPPIWSPDSKAQITWVERYKVEGEPNDFVGEFVYLDITNDFATRLKVEELEFAEGDWVTLFGWLVNQPAE